MRGSVAAGAARHCAPAALIGALLLLLPGMSHAGCSDVRPTPTGFTLAPFELKFQGEVLASWCEAAAGDLYVLSDPALKGHIQPPRELSSPKNFADFYPIDARRAGIQGQVILMIRVDPDGSVGAIAAVGTSHFEILDLAASKYYKQVRFKVGPRLDGKPVSVVLYAPVHFSLSH